MPVGSVAEGDSSAPPSEQLEKLAVEEDIPLG